MSMLIHELRKKPEIELDVCFTGQHKEMVLPLIDFFEIKVNCALDIMQPNQSLSGLTSRSVEQINLYLKQVKPDLVLVQGDTTTAMCAALASFYNKIPVGHIEAGLRTHNMQSPYPEEFNRQVIAKIADMHFAPTLKAQSNLLEEKVDYKSVFMTGNTVIDALLYTKNKFEKNSSLDPKKYPWIATGNPYVLITGHRRENFGSGFENICNAIKELAIKYGGINFIYPVHLNPNVLTPVKTILSKQQNIYLIPPLEYIEFTMLLANSYLVLTDSGGVQEEAPAFGKPTLVMRDNTERAEAIEAGVSKLVGTNKETIMHEVSALIDSPDLYKKMSTVQNPFGRGDAAQQITNHILNFFRA